MFLLTYSLSLVRLLELVTVLPLLVVLLLGLIIPSSMPSKLYLTTISDLTFLLSVYLFFETFSYNLVWRCCMVANIMRCKITFWEDIVLVLRMLFWVVFFYRF